jgi:hypothetical protein
MFSVPFFSFVLHSFGGLHYCWRFAGSDGLLEHLDSELAPHQPLCHTIAIPINRSAEPTDF